MRAPQLDEALVGRLYRRSKAERWNLPVETFAEALRASAAKAGHDVQTSSDLERGLEALHLEDLALACACASGSDAAWEHFVLQQRPALYRAADTLDASGAAREIADSLYADLYGLTDRSGVRQSLFRYFQGRSSLATWLRSVLAQRHVDRLRAQRRSEPLSDEEPAATERSSLPDPDRMRYVALAERALHTALSGLEPRDRLRLGCYYAHDLTLAEIGRLLGEHEATASRHLARTRRRLREEIEQNLRLQGLDPTQIEECLSSVVGDAGTIDLGGMLETEEHGKDSGLRRSIDKGAARREHQA
jgi:RNA polymerase sigma-70 factor (ECF subfamily)